MMRNPVQRTIVAVSVLCLAASFLAILTLGRYQEASFADQYLFTSADGPPTSSPLTEYIVGVHAFGDFVVTYENVVRTPFTPYVSPVAYGTPYPPSLVLLLRGIFPHFSYKTLLWMFLLSSVIALVIPSYWASRRMRIPDRLIIISLFGLLPFPALMALDRGNPQTYLVPALFLAALYLERGKWAKAALMILVGTLIKFYPIYLLAALLARRRLSLCVLSALGAAGTMLLALLWFDQSYSSALSDLYAVLSHHSGRDATVEKENFAYFNWSADGAAYRISQLFGTPAVTNFVETRPYALPAVILVTVIATLRSAWNDLPSWIRSFLYLAPTQLCVPISYPYAMTWVLIPIAFAFRSPFTAPTSQRVPKWLQLCVAATLGIVVSIKPTWASVTAILIPESATWTNASQLIDPLLILACVFAVAIACLANRNVARVDE
jgi:hypothetical protein